MDLNKKNIISLVVIFSSSNFSLKELKALVQCMLYKQKGDEAKSDEKVENKPKIRSSKEYTMRSKD